MTRWFRVRAGRDGESGTTLIELMVAMTITSVLGVSMVGLISNMTRGETSSNSRVQETMDAQTQLDRVTHYLRAAWLTGSPPASFSVATATHATFYADLGDASGPELVDLNVAGPTTAGVLTETLTKATGAPTYVWNGVVASKIDQGNLVTSSPVFSYFDITGAALTAPVTGTTLASIGEVRVSLTEMEPGRCDPITVSTLVILRNVEYQ
jgi:Tfp pilus assembly protein PilW